MRLVRSNFEIIEPKGYAMEDIYKQIEVAGRVSHKSEHNIKDGSAEKFVQRMIKYGHNATLEFGTIYLTIPYTSHDFAPLAMFYGHNKYSHIEHNEENTEMYVTTNYRVLVEHEHLSDLEFLCEPTSHHKKRYCVKFILPIGISREFCRHRVFSFMEQSTRYCNYTSDKFGGEITYIIPPLLNIPEGNYSYIDGDWIDDKRMKIQITCASETADRYLKYLDYCSWMYSKLNDVGWSAQLSRGVLPLDTKTELFMCGFAEDWEHFFKLRDDKQHAHPQAYELAHWLHNEFIKKGYINVSGKELQFSDSNYKTAENFGNDNMDLNDFINTLL